MPKLGWPPGSPFLGAMADGTLRRFRGGFDERTMRLVIDPNDAQVLDFSRVEP